MKNYKFSVIIVTIYLFGFVVAGKVGVQLPWMLLLFSMSPFLILWMVYTILKYGKAPGKTLSRDEEWGYCDIQKDQLNTF